MISIKTLLLMIVVWASILVIAAFLNIVSASFLTVGPKRCQECHIEETKVWGKTAKFSGYKKLHKDKNAKRYLKAIGDKRIKKSPTCIMCHYTKVKNPLERKKI